MTRSKSRYQERLHAKRTAEAVAKSKSEALADQKRRSATAQAASNSRTA